MRKQLFVILVMLVIASFISFADDNKEKAIEKGQQAVSLMDEGKIEESIKLLREAEELDPENIAFPYELAVANYMLKNFNESITILEKIKEHPNSDELVYQLLGNSYDFVGNPQKCIESYNEGLEKFPKSGRLYLEKANIYLFQKKYDSSIYLYEKGIELDPKFPSNYYWASKLYLSSTEKVWGMIYGEIFMNLERNSRRTQEISKLLYDTYINNIKVDDTSGAVTFTEFNQINVNPDKPDDIKMPFGLFIYEPTLLLSIQFGKPVNIESISKTRENFISIYFQKKFDEKYPINLFAFQKKILDAGFMEPYSYWILMKGDEDASDKWINENKDKWEKFVQWFSDNPMKIDESNKFYTRQYK